MNRERNWIGASLAALAATTAVGLAANFSAFGPNGEGGLVNGQAFAIGAAGEVFEVDAFLRVDGSDLNGSATGTCARLSSNALPAGLGFTASASLALDGTDVTLGYAFTNTSGATLEGVRFFAILDAEIEAPTNTFFNEFAAVAGAAGAGFHDPDPEFWEVDEPDYLDGRIVERLQLGELANANHIADFPVDDVAMAIGFEIGDVPSGGGFTVDVLVSEDGDRLGALALVQHDRDALSNTVVTLSGRASFVGPPTLTLLGDNPLNVECHSTFVDPGATAVDGFGVDLTASVVVSGSVDSATLGAYTLTYSVVDGRGVAAEPATRVVNVVDTTAPTVACRDVVVHLAADGGASTAPGVRIDSPHAGESVAPGDVDVRFTTTNWTVGGIGDRHVRFIVDDDEPLSFFNGTNNVVQAGDLPGPTPLATWLAADQVRLHGLAAGAHSLRAELVMANGLLGGNEEAAVAVGFHVDADPAAPAVSIVSPLAGEAMAATDVDVQFAVSNWIVGGKGEPHVHFHLDGSPHRLMFYDGSNDVVELNTVPGPTPIASWIDPTTIRFHGLVDGVHRVRVRLADADHGHPDNVEADAEATFRVVAGTGGDVAIVPAADVDAGSSDACGLAALSLSPNRFTCADLGDNPVVLLATDIAGLTNHCTATVTVLDVTAPVITLTGSTSVVLECGQAYLDPGATAVDNCDGDISSNVVVDASALDSGTTGIYAVAYNVSDASGNAAVERTRLVAVVDTTPPELTCPTNVVLEYPGDTNVAAVGGAAAIDACSVPAVTFVDDVTVAGPGGGPPVGEPPDCSFDMRYILDGQAENGRFGSSVATAGDLDGDGFDDLLVGSPGVNAADVFSGVDGQLILALSPIGGESDFGLLVAPAGDVDLDTVPDLIVAATTNGPGGPVVVATIFSGTNGLPIGEPGAAELAELLDSGRADLGDVDGDGVADEAIAGTGTVEVVSGTNGATLYTVAVANAGVPPVVSGPGDINGDGVPDVLVGASYASPGGLPGAGSAFLLSGDDGTLLYQLDGDGAGDALGVAVSGAGDGSGDEIDDIAIGAPLAAPGGAVDAGSVYVVACGVPPDGAPPGCVIRTIERTWTAVDDSGNSTSCVQTIYEIDTTAPAIQCNAADITPPDAPISFTATATDAGGGATVEIVDYDCFMFTPNGKRIDKTQSCVVEIDGATVTIVDSGGVNTHITWAVVAVDGCGNAASRECEIVVQNPGNGGGDENGNNGVGNGEDPQPPGNPPVNDGPGTGPGNPGNQP